VRTLTSRGGRRRNEVLTRLTATRRTSCQVLDEPSLVTVASLALLLDQPEQAGSTDETSLMINAAVKGQEQALPHIRHVTAELKSCVKQLLTEKLTGLVAVEGAFQYFEHIVGGKGGCPLWLTDSACTKAKKDTARQANAVVATAACSFCLYVCSCQLVPRLLLWDLMSCLCLTLLVCFLPSFTSVAAH
jgi:hypothetical protein